MRARVWVKVWTQAFFGGVAAFSREQIMAVNGHSTEFWGWGKEGARGCA